MRRIPAMTADKPRRLDRVDFNRPTLRVARELLGKFIVHAQGRRRISAMITEVEAYKGPRDKACHAYGGRRTPRVEPLYGEGGTSYVYLVYGLHWLLNFATAGKDLPEGLLIRAVLADLGGAPKHVEGPGRVTRFLGVDKKLDGLDVTASRKIWIEDRGVRVPTSRVRRGPRIGIDFAGPYWAARPWRFWIEVEPQPGPTAKTGQPWRARAGRLIIGARKNPVKRKARR
jgi:DNA-3-methyladenine glycosylase